MTADTEPARRPTDDELDVHGLTHIGKVRRENHDHFQVITVHKRSTVLASSLPDPAASLPRDQRLASVAMVADGVGSGEGELASRLTVEHATLYTARVLTCFYGSDSHADSFTEQLESVVAHCHAEVVRRRQQEGVKAATTLTLWLGVWPSIFVVQVGDSRYYIYRQGSLRQVTRDQTVAQDLFDAGALTRTEAHRSPMAHVLSSAIGAGQAVPVVTRVRSEWGMVHLLCSDGLTRHVPDERIAERLRTMTSSKQAAEALLQDALDGGGSDNITIVVGRAVPAPGPGRA